MAEYSEPGAYQISNQRPLVFLLEFPEKCTGKFVLGTNGHIQNRSTLRSSTANQLKGENSIKKVIQNTNSSSHEMLRSNFNESKKRKLQIREFEDRPARYQDTHGTPGSTPTSSLLHSLNRLNGSEYGNEDSDSESEMVMPTQF
jgi:glutamine phosphoribosylpyrophosphate amidotransferase